MAGAEICMDSPGINLHLRLSKKYVPLTFNRYILIRPRVGFDSVSVLLMEI